MHVQGDEIDEFIQKEMARTGIPGAVVGVVRHRQVQKVGCYGFANLELRVPVSADSLFQAASIGKQFTAAAVLQLADKGLIGMEDSIRKYFPSSPTFWEKITIQHLLTHTSGLTNYDEGDPKLDYKREYSDTDFVNRIVANTPRFSPGHNWSYSNSGYLLLGQIISRITGKYFGDYFRSNLWRPAGMETVCTTDGRSLISNRSGGYQVVGGKTKHADWLSPCFGRLADGAQYWSVIDAIRWDEFLQSDPVMSSLTRRRMWTPIRFSDGNSTNFELGGAGYGFAWFIDREAGHQVFYHTGAFAGFVAYIARYPADGLTIVFCANLADAPIVAIGRGLARRALSFVHQESIADPNPALTLEIRKVLLSIRTAEIPIRMFGDAFPKERIAGLNRSLKRRLSRLGDLGDLELLESLSHCSVYRARYRLRYSTATLRLEVVCDENSRLSGPFRLETE